MTEVILDPHEGRVRCPHKKAAIIGAAPGRRLAPWDDGSWCFWMINEIPQPRFDRHFELHPMSVQSPHELAWLRRCKAPCYTLEHEPEIPGSVRYPIERILEAFGRDYFTCTFAFQIALALLDGFEEIGLWGVDLPLGNWRERVQESACVNYWVGVAEGRGVKVTMPEGTWLLRHPYRYGYDYHDEMKWVENEGQRLLGLLHEKFPETETWTR